MMFHQQIKKVPNGASLLFRVPTRKNILSIDELDTDSTHHLKIKSFSEVYTCSTDNSVDTTQHVYKDMVSEAVKEIKKGSFKKVVVARQEHIKPTRPFDIQSIFHSLCQTNPLDFCFLINSPKHGVWLGASPELLLEKRGSTYRTIALAGTLPATPGFMWSNKERIEQGYVVEDIVNRLKKIDAKILEVTEPVSSLHGKVVHLKTIINFEFDGAAKMVLDALYPSSALCGYPQNDALAFIEAHEKFDRKLYTGYVAIKHPNGDLDAYILLRCAQILEGSVVLYAGGGIVADSDPQTEWDETVLKMLTMKQFFV